MRFELRETKEYYQVYDTQKDSVVSNYVKQNFDSNRMIKIVNKMNENPELEVLRLNTKRLNMRGISEERKIELKQEIDNIKEQLNGTNILQ